MSIERISFVEEFGYISVEAAIHLNRYLCVKDYVKGKKVLDAACGEGYGSKLLKTWGAISVVGVDVSNEAIANAKAYFEEDGITFICGDVESMPFDDNCFDLVVSFETIEHLKNPELFLKEINRVKTEDATVIISCPNDYIYKEHIEDYNNEYHVREYRFHEFREMTEKYFGTDANWYFGFGVNGFINIPEKYTTLPEKCDNMPKDMHGIFDYQRINNAFNLYNDRYINHWNSNYYIGIWNSCNGADDITAATFPREFFAENIEHNPLKEVEQNVYKKREYELLKKIHIVELEKDRISNLLRLANEEKALLWSRIGRLEWDLNNLRNSKAVKLVFKFWNLRDKIKTFFRRK